MFRLRKSELNLPPGPTFFTVLRTTWQMRDNQHELLRTLWQDYGDVVRIPSAVRTLYLVSDPELVKHILQDNNRNYVKGRGLQKAKALVGHGLLTSEGDFWRRQRRLMQPAFHRQRIADFVQTMTTAAAVARDRMAEQAKQGVPVNVAASMMHLTLDIISQTMFSTALRPEEMAQVEEVMPFLLRVTTDRTTALLDVMEHLPTSNNKRYDEYRNRLDGIVYRIIEERRRSGQRHNDLLDMLLEAQDEDTGERMDDAQLRDEAITIFLAGHETTANLLAWALHLLSQHPQQSERLQAEVDGVLDGRVPTMADLGALRYTRMVLDEALRLYPPAWIFSRAAVKDDRLGTYDLPTGTDVLISPYIIHRDPRFWQEPERFDPERFDPAVESDRPRFAYLPFGAGPRLCIGRDFALIEATLILAMLVQRFTFAPVAEKPVEPIVSFTLRPKNGVWLEVQERP